MPRKALLPRQLMRGPFTVDQARAAGLQRWHLEGSAWKRLTRGVYAWAGSTDLTLWSLHAISKRFPTSAAFSGITAAWLHGIDVAVRNPIEVTVPPHIGVFRPQGVRVRRALLAEEDVVRIRGVRATSIARTIADVAAVLNLTEAVVLADAALHARLVSLGELERWSGQHAGRRGIRRLREVIIYAEPKSESPMESRLRMALVLSGLPRPRAQIEIFDAGGRFLGRPDLFYDSARLGIEYDGRSHRDSLAADDHRQNNLLTAGVRLLRFTYTDVVDEPASVIAQVAALLPKRIG